MQDYVDASWDEDDRDFIARYLQTGLVAAAYMGYSTCRVCGRTDNGDLELSDGKFVWPNGLFHYITEHAVRLPNWFVSHAYSTTETLESAKRSTELWAATVLGEPPNALDKVSQASDEASDATRTVL